MTDLTIRRNVENDLAPLARLLADPDAMTLVNPNAKQPFDPVEWQEKWLGEMHDEDFYLALVERRLTDAQRQALLLPCHALHAGELAFEWRDREWQFEAKPEGWFTGFCGG